MKYPKDRYNGYVVLHVNGKAFVPDWGGTSMRDAMAYSGAFLRLAKRYQEEVNKPASH